MKYLLAFLLFIYNVEALEQSNIHIVKTVAEIESYIKDHYDDQTCIVFDVDYVLITGKDKIFRPCGEKKGLRKQLFNSLKEKTLNKYKIIDGKKIPLYEYLMNVLIFMTKNECVDSQLASFIVKLQKKFPVIALTHNESGPIGLISSQSTKKINDLKEIGIEFKNAFFCPERIILNQVSSKEGLYPVYDKGVLFTNGVKKGEVLKAFLISQNYKPKKLIFIDDRKEYLESVNNALNSLGVSFIGLHFTQLIDREQKIEKALAEYQFNFLLENEIWLDDELAEKNLIYFK